jgi:hypothetical protein
MKGRIKWKERLEQLLDNLREKRRSWNFREQALTVW